MPVVFPLWRLPFPFNPLTCPHLPACLAPLVFTCTSLSSTPVDKLGTLEGRLQLFLFFYYNSVTLLEPSEFSNFIFIVISLQCSSVFSFHYLRRRFLGTLEGRVQYFFYYNSVTLLDPSEFPDFVFIVISLQCSMFFFLSFSIFPDASLLQCVALSALLHFWPIYHPFSLNEFGNVSLDFQLPLLTL